VREIPPFLMAGLRFTVAGAVMWTWMRVTGTRSPTLIEWREARSLGTFGNAAVASSSEGASRRMVAAKLGESGWNRMVRELFRRDVINRTAGGT
jgi:hypothetical protein